MEYNTDGYKIQPVEGQVELSVEYMLQPNYFLKIFWRVSIVLLRYTKGYDDQTWLIRPVARFYKEQGKRI